MKRYSHGLLIFTVIAALLSLRSLSAEDAKPELKETKIKSITLKVPASWEQKEPSNRLRLAEFDIPPVKGDGAIEFVVYSFGGGGGGVKANVDRWVQQFQADGREVKVYEGTSAQGPYVLVDIKGTYNKPVGPPIQMKTEPMENAQMLAAIITIADEGNYFLKLTGGQNTLSQLGDDIRASFGADLATEKETELTE